MNVAPTIQYRLSDLVQGLDVTIQGDENCIISGISSIQSAVPGQITFFNNAIYKKYLASTKASAIIISPDFVEQCPINAVVTRNPYFTYACIAKHFSSLSETPAGIHPSSVVGENCQIDPSAIIGPNCSIANNVTIEKSVFIGANCTIAEGCRIAAGTTLDANVSLYHRVQIGMRCHINSGAVIGSDGFGFANHNGVWHKVPQLGSVIIGNDVDVGANTTIDRGAIEDTIIEDGVKLDNLIQVAHNVVIGANTVIAGCVAIAGSTTLGKNCMVGGGSCFAGHITIADNTMITGMTAVTKSITEPGMYSSGIVGAVPNKEFRKNNARFHRLENLNNRVKKLESHIKVFVSGDNL